MGYARGSSRRDFLKALAAGAAALPLSRFAPAGTRQAATKPNFLFILIDDLRWDVFSCMGHPFIKTPSIDRIRNEGALFSNAFVTNSLCSPSRASFQTGTYNHINGVLGNDDYGVDFDPATTPGYSQILRDQAGYKTAYIGKWHMDNTTDMPRPGFDYWLSFKGQGVYDNPTLNENGTQFAATGYNPDLLTDYCVNWLDANGSQPFSVILAHKAVHAPFTPATRHAADYTTDTQPEPLNYNDSLTSKPQWQRFALAGLTRYRSRDFRAYPSPAVPASYAPRTYSISANQRDYYRTLNGVDDSVGRVLQKLQDLGQLDNTVIVFAGDNGYFWGEHRRTDKRLMYEESLRIPMFIRYPPAIAAGSTISQMVLNIDLAPTFLEMAGAAIPAVMQGRSWVPLFSGNAAGWRASFLYEYFVDMNPALPRMVGARAERWKYVRYPDLMDIDEMYDLQTDPYELANLVAEPDSQNQAAVLRAELDRLLQEANYQNIPWVYKPTSVTPMVSLDFTKASGAVAPDDSGKGNNGTIVGATYATDGYFGQVLQFSGASHVDVANSATLKTKTTPLTIEALVKPLADGTILAHGGQTRGYAFFVENGIPSFAIREAGTPTITVIVDGIDSCIGKWVHLAATYDKRLIRLYVDGKKVDAIVPTFQKIAGTPTEAMQIGLDGSTLVDTSTATGFTGQMKLVRVYGTALSDDEIRRLRASYYSASCVPRWKAY